MIPILTLSEMKDVERKTQQESGLTESDMIASAGEAVFESLKTMLEEVAGEDLDDGDDMDDDEDDGDDPPGPLDPPAPRRRPEDVDFSVAFVCGAGHNGADGLSAALLASQAGYGVVIYQIQSDNFSGETEKLQQQLLDADLTINFIRSPLDLPVFQEIDVIVDALLGSGINRDPEGLLQSCIFGMNQSGVPILSVDVPSGVRCDTAEVTGSAVQASATVCLGAMKVSAAFYPSSLCYGKVGYSPICFDEKMLLNQPSRLRMYSLDDAVQDYPERDFRTNKYTAGKALVIAGSRGMHGAAALCGNAALRAGAGLVKLAYPGGIHPELSVHLLEIIGVPVGLPEGAGYGSGVGHFRPQDIAELEPLLEWADSILLGPGLGKHPETAAFVDALIPKLKGKRVVLDGDALAYFKPDFAERYDLRGYDSFVLTPHAGEYKRMGGDYNYDQPLDLIRKARDWAQERNLNLVLKGATTLFAAPDGRILVLPVGNPGMATAGSGDVLAGVIVGILAVKPPEQAASLGAFAHGKAGDLARKDRGTLSMVASDLLLYLPLALLEVEEGGTDEPGDWITD